MTRKISALTGSLGFLILLSVWSCKAPDIVYQNPSTSLPGRFTGTSADSSTIAQMDWRSYFGDSVLIALIDSGLMHNQELQIVAQELAIGQSEVLEKSGEYLPFLNLGVGAGADKVGRYTRDGAVEHNLEIADGREFPEPLGDFVAGINVSWEVDVWRRLRNAKDAAQLRYLAQTEGKNLLVTRLVAEIASTYYELIALDNLLAIINKNVAIQAEALAKVRLLKDNARASQLAVNRFEAQWLNTQNQLFGVQQQRTETANRLLILTGSLYTDIPQFDKPIISIQVDSLQAGIPAQLLDNRPDIRQAAREIEASRLDLKVAKANFYPRLDLTAGLGFQAFNPSFLFNPESLIFNAVGDLMAPIVNRRAIQASFARANAAQLQCMYAYQLAVINGYTEVINQLAKLDNYTNSCATKSQEVSMLNQSVEIANNLFLYAKADYLDVLLTQEESLDAQMELVETKLQQLQARVQLYAALGGGWR